MWEALGKENAAIDSACIGKLAVEIDALTFFRDNEYDTDIQDGYSLPGTWVRPTLQYAPTGNIKLELGASGLFFHGANKYPCYAYHDIGTWKGNQYQDGAHLLPWFRAQVSTGNWTFVLGDIYGGTNHGFSTPLYNCEQLLSADPEAGFQILCKSKHFSLDTYINWQSYQFEEDTHQEAFSVGAVAKYNLCKDFGIKAQMLLQHRGGEQDLPELGLGVQTIANGALGIEYEKSYVNAVVNYFSISPELIGCYQQKGGMWSFDSGIAYHINAEAQLFKRLNISAGCLYAPKDFVTIYGNPFFSTVSIKDPTLEIHGIRTEYLNIGYSQTWAKAYTLGANLEIFNVHPKGRNGYTPFSFGIYFRLSPKWTLGK